MSDLLVFTCHFNPCRFRRPLENYHRFREALDRDDILRTVEVSFDGHFEIPDAIHIEAGPKNKLWQKERLVNWMTERFKPAVYAWVDADLLFPNNYWPEAAAELLEETPIVQLFSGIIFQDRDGFPEIFRNSMVAHRLRNGKKRATTSPGGAWMARRDVLPRIPFEENIIGGGDDAFARCLFGDWEPIVPRMGTRWLRRYLIESVPLFRSLRGRVGYYDQTLTHLWHGSKDNRQYGTRHNILIENDFDPAEDIRIGSSGLWEWASDKPALHHGVRQYFEARKEDND